AVLAGQQRVVIDRVSPILADKTLTATCTGARVLDVRCERYVAPWRESTTFGEPAKLRAELDALDAKRSAASALARTARAEAAALAQLAAASLADLATAATRGTATPDAAERLRELDAGEATALQRAIDAELEVDDLAAAHERLDQRLRRAEAEA